MQNTLHQDIKLSFSNLLSFPTYHNIFWGSHYILPKGRDTPEQKLKARSENCISAHLIKQKKDQKTQPEVPAHLLDHLKKFLLKQI